MKKKKIMMIGIVAALVLMGVAFAAWTANVDVNVNAKSGELDVEIVKTKVLSSSDYVSFAGKNILVSEDKKTATVSMDNLYPGGEAVFTIQVKNTGTLPIELTSLTHTTIKVLDKDTNEDYGRNTELFEYFNTEYTAEVIDKKGNTLGSLSTVSTASVGEWDPQFYMDNDLIQIEPGESILLTVKVYLDDKALENTENKIFQFSITPTFGQAN